MQKFLDISHISLFSSENKTEESDEENKLTKCFQPPVLEMNDIDELVFIEQEEIGEKNFRLKILVPKLKLCK